MVDLATGFFNSFDSGFGGAGCFDGQLGFQIALGQNAQAVFGAAQDARLNKGGVGDCVALASGLCRQPLFAGDRD